MAATSTVFAWDQIDPLDLLRAKMVTDDNPLTPSVFAIGIAPMVILAKDSPPDQDLTVTEGDTPRSGRISVKTVLPDAVLPRSVSKGSTVGLKRSLQMVNRIGS